MIWIYHLKFSKMLSLCNRIPMILSVGFIYNCEDVCISFDSVGLIYMKTFVHNLIGVSYHCNCTSMGYVTLLMDEV